MRLLRRERHEVGSRRVRMLMKRTGVEALCCRPDTRHRNAEHKIWSYLLRGMKIDRTNQAWALDKTYIPISCTTGNGPIRARRIRRRMTHTS